MLHIFKESEVVIAEESGGDQLLSLGLLRQRERRGYESGEESSAEQLRSTTSRDVGRSRGSDTHLVLSYVPWLQIDLTGKWEKDLLRDCLARELD